jgi:hypothetical protein
MRVAPTGLREQRHGAGVPPRLVPEGVNCLGNEQTGPTRPIRLRNPLICRLIARQARTPSSHFSHTFLVVAARSRMHFGLPGRTRLAPVAFSAPTPHA